MVVDARLIVFSPVFGPGQLGLAPADPRNPECEHEAGAEDGSM